MHTFVNIPFKFINFKKQTRQRYVDQWKSPEINPHIYDRLNFLDYVPKTGERTVSSRNGAGNAMYPHAKEYKSQKYKTLENPSKYKTS